MRKHLKAMKGWKMDLIIESIRRTGPATPARDTVLPLMPAIKVALSRGASRSAIYNVLVDKGVKVGCGKSGFNAAIRYYLGHPELWDRPTSPANTQGERQQT